MARPTDTVNARIFGTSAFIPHTHSWNRKEAQSPLCPVKLDSWCAVQMQTAEEAVEEESVVPLTDCSNRVNEHA